MKLLDWLVDRTRAISRFSLWVAGALLIATVVLISAEIVVRKLGSGMVSGASEVGGFMLAICSVWAFSYTLLQRSNIRFDILYVRCSEGVRSMMDLLGLLGLGVFACIVTYHAYAVLATSISFGARSVSSLSVPLWIPLSVWFAGLVFLCWTVLILAARVLVALLHRDYATVARLAGTVMADEEIARETAPIPGSKLPMHAPALRTPVEPER
jgi:TRAP-type mannitol/chloroaromatic compound transport system permease small subunit